MSELKKAKSLVTVTLDLSYKYPHSRDAWLAVLELIRSRASIDDAQSALISLNIESKRPADFVYSTDRHWPDLTAIERALWIRWHDALDDLLTSTQFSDRLMDRALSLVDIAAEEMDGTEANLESRLSQRARRALMNVQRVFRRLLTSNWIPSVPVDHYLWIPLDELWDAVRPIETLSETRMPVERCASVSSTQVRTAQAREGHPSGVPPVSSFVEDSQYQFQLFGTVWHVRFGSEYGEFDQSRTRGIQYIWALLAQPNPINAVSASSLYKAINLQVNDTADVALAARSSKFGFPTLSHQKLVDGSWRRDVEEELALLRKSLLEIDTTTARQTTQRRIVELDSVLRQSTGLGGRSRAFPVSDENRRARENIRAAIRSAIRLFRSAVPPMSTLALHLEESIRYESDKIAYRPPVPDKVSWTV